MVDVDIDDLEYEWPVHVLNFETRYIFGLTVYDMMTAAFVGMSLMVVNVIVGVMVMALVVILWRRYEALGDRRPLEYIFLRLLYRYRGSRLFSIPLIMAASPINVVIEDADGGELVRF